MNVYAIIDNGTVINTIVFDGAAPADWPLAAGQTMVEIPQTAGSPGVGWTTTDGGQTWTAPTPPAPPTSPTPT